MWLHEGNGQKKSIYKYHMLYLIHISDVFPIYSFNKDVKSCMIVNSTDTSTYFLTWNVHSLLNLY